MAKKRVHEIAKERGMSSKDVIAVLQKAGLDVKAAASSVDENDIKRAFSNGADAPQQPNGGAAAGAEPAAPAREQRQPQAPRADGGQQQRPQRPAGDGQQSRPPQQQPSEQRPQRPQRRPEQGAG